MSDKLFYVSKDIYQKYKYRYNLDALEIFLIAMLLISVIVNIINFYTGHHSIVTYIICLLTTILSSICIYRKVKINKKNNIDNHKFNEKIFEVFKVHNITTERELLILKEEIEKELNEINQNTELHKKRFGKLFLYIFWIPNGFLLAYYFNNSNEKLHFNELLGIGNGLFVIFIQIFILYIMLFNVINPLFNVLVIERNRYYITLDYIYEYLYYTKI
ncbi:MAG TPA: hypothetical protein DEB65_08930 [Staphylococcus sp.]|uniref:hypothetical protein n=1 Tax=Mammaliicoccus lentus TaxID=42858 RepID=UPI000CD279FA|nr:hypothetical protein [Mammaliicoccus lentus]POA03747.1 hypothetical protein CD135_09900 [Mammaliicoccus lentus]SUM50673.1 Uncharacterised protein [Mammaliicoccus lentus]HBV04382.1 hypothetical protein [Staphylococcus sp.]